MVNQIFSLYIDPGTGSMLFTVLIGILSAAVYLVRTLIIKLKSGAGRKADKNRIPLVIYSDSKRYWNTFEPICDELEARGVDTVFMTSSPDDPALSKEYKHIRTEFIGEGNKAFTRLNMLNATLVFCTTPGLDVLQWKRSRSVDYYVHIMHAPRDAASYRMFELDYFDAILFSGQVQIDQIRELEKLRGLPKKELRIVGIPYMDEMMKRVEAAGPAPKSDKTTVLLAPSWGVSSLLVRYGETMIKNLLDTGYHVIIRPHPQSFTADKEVIDRLMAEFPNSENLEWNRDNDNFEVLRRSDIMISDFSGVMLDFAFIFDKPVIYADIEFDKGQYDYYFLKEEPWSLTMLPKIGMGLTIDNAAGVKDLIEECLTNPKFKETRAQAREEIWQCRGEGASNTADYIVAKLKQLEQKEENENKKESGKKAAGK